MTVAENYAGKLKKDYADKKPMVLGIDIGGTSIKWGLAEVTKDGTAGDMLIVNSGDTTEKAYYRAVPTYIESDPATQSLAYVLEAYHSVVRDAQIEAEKQGGYITGIGVGSPGRFISVEDYLAHYADGKDRPSERFTNAEREEFKKKFGCDPYVRGAAQDNGDSRVVAPGSNPNMAKKQDSGGAYSELDAAALPAMLQALSPVKVALANDAAVQMQAIVNGLDVRSAAALQRKKAIYIGIGTGIGAAVMDEEGKLVTDGHFQHTRFAKRANDPVAEKLYEDVRDFYVKEGKVKPGEDISPEMMFNADNLKRQLNGCFPDEQGGTFDEQSRRCQKRFLDAAPNDAAQVAEAKEKFAAVGRYMADFLANVQQGHFEHRDPKAAWTEADKEQIKGFENVVFGGGYAVSPQFNEFILPATKTELESKGIALGKAGEACDIGYVCADQQTMSHTLRAGMALLDKQTLLMSPEEVALSRGSHNAR